MVEQRKDSPDQRKFVFVPFEGRRAGGKDNVTTILFWSEAGTSFKIVSKFQKFCVCLFN